MRYWKIALLAVIASCIHGCAHHSICRNPFVLGDPAWDIDHSGGPSNVADYGIYVQSCGA